jgi:hypothetical protein
MQAQESARLTAIEESKFDYVMTTENFLAWIGKVTPPLASASRRARDRTG